MWALITGLSVLSLHIKAQDTLAVMSNAPISVPDGLDSAKLDSFFLIRNIDLRVADKPELYFEIYRWYRTCYHYGGNSQNGIDCSHFVNMLYEKIYGVTLGPSVWAILPQCHILKKGLKEAQEGDLVFFKIRKGQVSHVGIYLQNGKFAHATVHAGVIISDMEEPYYKHRFYKVGRLLRGATPATN
ncbi:MAG TPA: NlpC/P60 family protein [Chitinophagales bacterium]|nr:NlpC/P60 family protein [Chitinophagales bacterium]